jgi:hypothetical protein
VNSSLYVIEGETNISQHSNSRDGNNDKQLQFKAELNTVSSIALFGGKTNYLKTPGFQAT